MKLKFEHDYQQKIMLQAFEETFRLDSPAAIQTWRSTWMQELKSWHSPYKLIIDCTNLIYVDTPDAQDALKRMLKFFEGLFLRSIVGYGLDPAKGHDKLPFKMVASFEDAQREAGVRGMRDPKAPVDFRGSIQFQNHFAQHVIEMSFSDDVVIDTKEKLDAIKSKLTNNLMQWHSKWSLLIDCSRVTFDPSMRESWEKMEKLFKDQYYIFQYKLKVFGTTKITEIFKIMIRNGNFGGGGQMQPKPAYKYNTTKYFQKIDSANIDTLPKCS